MSKVFQNGRICSIGIVYSSGEKGAFLDLLKKGVLSKMKGAVFNF